MCNRNAACLTLGALLLAVAGCARSVQDRPIAHDDRPAGLLISNVHVFDASSGAFSEPAGILIRDGRIHAVGPSHELGKPEEEIDARGAFALPALWDSHVHLSVRALEGPDAVRETLEGFVQAGVLYVRDVGGPLDVIAPMRDLVRAGDVVGPEIFFSGPMAERPPLMWAAHNEKLPGFTVPIESEAQVDSLVTSVARAGGAFVKTFGKWDVDLFRRLVRLAGEADLEVVVDPGAPFFQDIPIDVALAAGVSSIEHAHTAWQSALSASLKAKHDSLATGTDPAALVGFINEVGPLGLDALDLDSLRALADRMTAAGAYLCPTLQVAEAWRTAHPSLPGFAPQNPDRLWNGFADVATKITQAFAERGVKLLIGQDGMDPGGTVREMELLVAIGVPPADVLRAATVHPARWLKRDQEIGSLQVGRRADLVLVRADPLRDMTALRSPVLVVQAGTVRRRPDIK
jgi:imidazolonepropionase-like amidohydrolase